MEWVSWGTGVGAWRASGLCGWLGTWDRPQPRVVFSGCEWGSLLETGGVKCCTEQLRCPSRHCARQGCVGCSGGVPSRLQCVGWPMSALSLLGCVGCPVPSGVYGCPVCASSCPECGGVSRERPVLSGTCGVPCGCPVPSGVWGVPCGPPTLSGVFPLLMSSMSGGGGGVIRNGRRKHLRLRRSV